MGRVANMSKEQVEVLLRLSKPGARLSTSQWSGTAPGVWQPSGSYYSTRKSVLRALQTRGYCTIEYELGTGYVSGGTITEEGRAFLARYLSGGASF